MTLERMRRYKLSRIKPCPFCGGFSTVAEKSKTYIKGELTYITYCYCTECDTRGKRIILNEDERTRRESYELAIASWNRRVNDED